MRLDVKAVLAVSRQIGKLEVFIPSSWYTVLRKRGSGYGICIRGGSVTLPSITV